MQENKTNNLTFAFWGTSEVSVYILEELKKAGLIPSLVVTLPDRPKGRKLVVTRPAVKIWADTNNIKTLQPEKLDEKFALELLTFNFQLFIVVAYGKIIPKNILDIPKYKSLNIHYSLLAKLRGPSPVEGAILTDDREIGVSIILMDEKMDHGPVTAQEKVEMENWPPKKSDLLERMNEVAGKLLIKTIPEWIEGKIKPKEQVENKATYVKMIKKEDALIDFKDDDYLNFRKIMAYEKWPRAYFFQDNKRVIINLADFREGKLDITRVTPEGKKEMNYKDYLLSSSSEISRVNPLQ